MDTHCHSSASSGPAIKALGLIGCPECYSPPERVYEQALARGMDLVTITDHDTIDGALSLVERGFERVVIGEEVTVCFPEDACRLHVLVWCLTPELHEAIGALRLREDVYAFAAWLREHNLPHALAHPLYVQNHKLTRWHLDRCALLFKGFEILNGAHAGTHRAALETYLKNLTAGTMHRLIQEQGIEPLWPRSWEKSLTGGSDDHGLLNVGRTWTQVDSSAATDARVGLTATGKVADGRDFFKLVMNAHAQPGGNAGHSALLAHQLATVGAHYYAHKLADKATPRGRFTAHKLLRFAGVPVAPPSRLALGWQALRDTLRRKRSRLGPLLMALRESLGPVLARHPELSRGLARWDGAAGAPMANHEQMTQFADGLYEAMHECLAGGVIRGLRAKDTSGIIDHLASYAVLELSQLPYLFSLFHQNKERDFVEQLEHETSEPGSGLSVLERPMRVLLFTDTLGDVNGVSRFIVNAADQAAAGGHDLRVITSTNMDCPQRGNIVNFKPVFSTKMPRYEHLELALPPLVRMLRFVDQHQPDVIHISTPGPVGIVGFIASRMVKAPIVGVYHTDFPAYVENLFQDEALTYVTSRFMRYFYAPFRSVFTRSSDYVESLTRLGMARERVLALMPGIRTEEFRPEKRDLSIWAGYGSTGSPVRVLSVGRVSVEKNLPLLTKVWRAADARLRSSGVQAELVVVGDGPYRKEMEEQLRGTRVRFLGFRYGEELARIYASSDLFVFPSITDTLGQVVMEAQASGVPVLVSDQGGPKEVVQNGQTGLVISADNAGRWVDAVVALAGDAARRRAMGSAAHEFMQDFSMDKSFQHFWGVHEEAWVECLNSRGLKARGPMQRGFAKRRARARRSGAAVPS
jgi:glycosyltransferase involved in cell wall biosynthesis